MAFPCAAAAYAYAVLVALGLGYFIALNPLQVNDCLGNMIKVQRAGFWEMLHSEFTNHAFLRPFLWAQLHIGFNLANGHYLEMFKTIHVLQLVATALLFVNLLRVRTVVGALAVPFGVAVLFGSHTFAGTVVEGFPINTFLTIAVCCLLAAHLSFSAPSLWRDIAAVLLFVFAVLTVESGVLIWVGLVAAWVAGCRGVSARAILVVTALLGAYFFLRFGPLAVGAPSLLERSSGFGFRVLDPPELVARFGNAPYVFYAYNVVAQVLTVLFSEPKGGVWMLTRNLMTGELLPRDVIAVGSSVATTLLICWWGGTRIRDWRQSRFEHGDRMLFILVAVLGANAVVSYPYTKDVIVSPAGVFYALVATIAFGELLSRLSRASSIRPLALAMSLMLALLSAAWGSRLVAIHYGLREKAFIIRNDWMAIYHENRPPGVDLEKDAAAAALVKQLYEQAITMRTVAPHFGNRSAWRYLEIPW